MITSIIGAGVASPYSDEAEDFEKFLAAGVLPESPLEWGFTLTALAVCFPAALLVVNIAGRRRLGSLFSVAGRFRWPLMCRAMAISLVAIGLAYALSHVFFDDVTITMDRAALAILALTLVLVPFQAAAEELLFRGVAAQAIGSWLRHPAFAFIIPTPIFVALHAYNYLGLLDIAIFGLCAGFLAWATGGLEVPIGFHIANNWVAIGTAAFIGENPAEPTLTIPTTIFSVSTTLLITAFMYFDKQLTIQTTGTAEAIEKLPPAAIVAPALSFAPPPSQEKGYLENMSNPSDPAHTPRPVGFPHDNASVAQRLGGEVFGVQARGFTFDGFRAQPSAAANGTPTVVLVHGWPQFASCWEEIARTLLDQGFEVVAYDQRGYSPGARPGEVADYTLEQLAGDIDEVTRALEIEKFHLVGHDWGGIIGWIYAAAHPERLHSFTSLASPHPVGQLQATAEDPGQYEKMGYIRGIQADPAASRDALFADDAALLRALYGGAVDDETVAAYVERFREPGIMDAALKYYQALGQGKLPPNLTVTVPTLYIWGDEDIAFSRSSAEKAEEFVSGEYKFVDLAGASHWLPEERADEIAPEICAWIAVHEG